MFELEMINFYI